MGDAFLEAVKEKLAFYIHKIMPSGNQEHDWRRAVFCVNQNVDYIRNSLESLTYNLPGSVRSWTDRRNETLADEVAQKLSDEYTGSWFH